MPWGVFLRRCDAVWGWLGVKVMIDTAEIEPIDDGVALAIHPRVPSGAGLADTDKTEQVWSREYHGSLSVALCHG